jgi:ABC-type transporter MlaC component
MKKILTTLILLLWTQVIYAEDSPEKIVNVVANKVFNELKSNPNIVKNNKLLNELVEKELMPFINHKYISLKILRKYIKKNKREDIYYFINNSQPFLIKTFSNALKFYKQQDYIITKNRSSSKKIKKINMIIQNDRNKNITLTFVFKFDKKST